MPSSRITQRFESCKAAGRTAFVAFVTAGYPSKGDTVDALLGLEESGADVIELGVPFSDPMADGATIEEASRLALEHSTSLADCFSFVEAARSKGLKVPLVLMGYYNNFLQHGLDKTCEDAKAKGVDGFIIVDLPCEQADDFHPKCVQHELSLVPIVAPTSGPERMKKAAAVADSFIYVVSVLGVTGARTQVSAGVKDVVANVKKATEGRGIFTAVGFGVSSREHVQEIGSYSDGCVVGSKIVQALGGSGGLASLKALVKELSGGPLAAAPTNGNHPAKRQRTGDVKTERESSKWYFGSFGGRYIPETLMQAHEDLSVAWEATKKDPTFQAEVKRLRTEFIGGPTPIYHAKNLSEKLGGAQLWFKREELAHTGAHKINNSLGQALLAKRLGKPRIIAETGAGQHGVATATACALLGLECVVYMGSIDMERQALNVFRMKMLGAKVVPAESGSKTLKDAINEAMRDWVTNITTTHYIIGSAVGPHPFPDIVRDLQSVIGTEARAQMLNDTSAHPTFTNGPGRLPDTVVACVGGGSNAIGMFAPFLEDKVEIHGVEAGGTVEAPKPDGNAEKAHSATLSAGTPGVLHGSNTYLLQTREGQITETHSISAGLDYPGVGPQHAFLKDSGRVKYVSVTDSQALQAMQDVSRNEGIIPALEPSHALYYSMELCKTRPKDHIVLVNLCGRGDKDMLSVAKALGVQLKD